MTQHTNIEAAKFIKMEVIDKLRKLEPDARPPFLNKQTDPVAVVSDYFSATRHE